MDAKRALELQVWSPLLAANEMANPSIGLVVERIAALPEYTAAFTTAFGRGADVVTLGQALAAYERGLLSADSAFDRWYFGGDRRAMSRAAVRGFGTFRDQGCAGCHTVREDYALFSDNEYHDTGVGYGAVLRVPPAVLQLAPGVAVTVTTPIEVPAANDLGRYEATLQPQDRWRYRTPTLRNVAVTAPYMHDGSLATLADVVDYYAAGGVAHEGQDARIGPKALSVRERADLVAFLEALTGSNVDALAGDARTVTIGDR